MPKRRVRRPRSESRRRILDAATALLAEGGVAAVQVRAVARQVGMTDAGVNHHFGSRDELLEQLVRHGARALRTELSGIIDEWLERGPDVGALVRAFARAYGSGLSDLALALHGAGWRDDRIGFLDPVVDAIHAHRRDPDLTIGEVRLAVAACHQAIALDSAFGDAFRRSAGLESETGDDAHLDWWTNVLESFVATAPTEDAVGPTRTRDHHARTV